MLLLKQMLTSISLRDKQQIHPIGPVRGQLFSDSGLLYLDFVIGFPNFALTTAFFEHSSHYDLLVLVNTCSSETLTILECFPPACGGRDSFLNQMLLLLIALRNHGICSGSSTTNRCISCAERKVPMVSGLDLAVRNKSGLHVEMVKKNILLYGVVHFFRTVNKYIV